MKYRPVRDSPNAARKEDDVTSTGLVCQGLDNTLGLQPWVQKVNLEPLNSESTRRPRPCFPHPSNHTTTLKRPRVTPKGKKERSDRLQFRVTVKSCHELCPWIYNVYFLRASRFCMSSLRRAVGLANEGLTPPLCPAVPRFILAASRAAGVGGAAGLRRLYAWNNSRFSHVILA